MNLLLGNCLEQLKSLAENSIDAVVTDPPYGLSFMGKKWDYDVPSVAIWQEALRVLKPGGHLLSFAGTRTYHRMAVNIEDAGFEIRDQIMWIYGSGFPKSTDVSKRIDKEAGAEREVIGLNPSSRPNSKVKNGRGFDDFRDETESAGVQSITAPATDSAKQWQGWGTALKPANEPIVVARKPLEKGLTVAQNVQKWRTGALNIDGSRIEVGPEGKTKGGCKRDSSIWGSTNNEGANVDSNPQGRWPANVLLDEEVSTHGEWTRYFYCAKASKKERNAGLEGMPEKGSPKFDGGSFVRGENNKDAKDAKDANFHPTVKPIKLMEYLIKLVTPPQGTVLDPFMGSGSTGVAAKNLGFNFIGIEREKEYFEIAKKRISQ